MAGQVVEKLPHLACGSSNALQTWVENGKYSGYCFSCGVIVKDPYEGKELPVVRIKSQLEIDAELATVKNCPFVPLAHRSIPIADWKHFGVRQGVSEYDGVSPNVIFHPYTRGGKVVAYKVKLLNKKVMWWIGENDGCDLYNWMKAVKAGGMTLYITEGEEDAIALRSILQTMQRGTDYAGADIAVVSLPGGIHSAIQAISPHLADINKIWKKVVLAFDNDEEGRKGAKEVKSKILPHAEIAILPAKDANACLRNGLLKATRDACVFQASKPVGTTLLRVSELEEEALEEVVWGKSYPWDGLTDLTYGQRKGELIAVGAGVGIGKSLLAHELAAHNFKEHGWKTLGIMMEESPAETVRNVCGKLDSIPYHVPGTEYDRDLLRSTMRSINDHYYIWNPDESTGAEETWEKIKTTIRAHGEVIDCLLLDNMTTLSEGLGSSERNDFIGKVCKEIVEMAMKFDFEVIVFSHLNSPDKGSKPHEAGGRVHENQFTGSRAVMRYAHMMIGFERNKQAVDPNCSIIRLLKNRKYGKTGALKTHYASETGRLIQRSWDDSDYENRKVG